MYPTLREYSNELVAESILAVANTRAAGLIAMSTHGRRGLGRWLYGSVAEHVLRYAEVPLLLIPPACERAWPEDGPLRLLVPLDGSPNAEAILGPVADLLAVILADVVVAQVIEAREIADFRPVPAPETAERAASDVGTAYLDAAATPLRAVARSVTIETAAGQPADALAGLAHKRDVDLIAMASHGQHGSEAAVLGHTTLRLLRQAGVPLLLTCTRAQPGGTGDHG
jgi:nucleotide-binding universal stress UspA family protein